MHAKKTAAKIAKSVKITKAASNDFVIEDGKNLSNLQNVISGINFWKDSVIVSSGYLALNAYSEGYGKMYVNAGGTAISTGLGGGEDDTDHYGTVYCYSEMFVSSGGKAIDTNVYRGNLVVSSGGTVSNTVVKVGDWYNDEVFGLRVEKGGIAIDTKLEGEENEPAVFSLEGNASSTTINNHGFFIVSSGGTATNTIVRNEVEDDFEDEDFFELFYDVHGFLVEKGGTAFNTTIKEKGAFSLQGKASSTTVSSGGIFAICSGGTAIDTKVLAGGKLIVEEGGKEINTTCEDKQKNAKNKKLKSIEP